MHRARVRARDCCGAARPTADVTFDEVDTRMVRPVGIRRLLVRLQAASTEKRDNAWQLTAATFVGLMSVPGLVVLYGGVMQKRWSVNSMMLSFAAFALVLIAWVLRAFDMGSSHTGQRSDLAAKRPTPAKLSPHARPGQG
jgi:Ammonium Transporter Family